MKKSSREKTIRSMTSIGNGGGDGDDIVNFKNENPLAFFFLLIKKQINENK
jgi:hypothetical protein